MRSDKQFFSGNGPEDGEAEFTGTRNNRRLCLRPSIGSDVEYVPLSSRFRAAEDRTSKSVHRYISKSQRFRRRGLGYPKNDLETGQKSPGGG